MSSTRRAALAAFAATALLVPSTSTPAAETAPVDPAACRPGMTSYSVSGGQKAVRVTHATKFQIAAHRTKTLRDPVEWHRTITAAVTGGGDGVAVLRAAHRRFLRYEDTIRRPGDHTTTEPADVGRETIENRSGKTRKYARYRAVQVYRGTWTKHTCGDQTGTATGTWRTFGSIHLDGDTVCPPMTDRKSPQGQACALVW